MIYAQGGYGWQECYITCKNCGHTIPGLYRQEIATGKSYYSDSLQDRLSESCPECGGEMSDHV